MNTIALAAVIAAASILTVVVVVLVIRGAIGGSAGVRRPSSAPTASVATIVLDVAADAATSPAVTRLVEEAASEAFASSATVERVVVTSRDGTRLARVERPTAPPPLPEATEPPREPRSRKAHVPKPTSVDRPASLHPIAPEDLAPGGQRALADAFDLPSEVRDLLREPDDPVDLLRAILTAAGHRPEIDGDLVSSGDVAVIVVRPAAGAAIVGDDLSRAYLRFQSAGVPRGIVLCLGFVRPDETRRRELLAPMLRHVGPDAIQRMADAVVAGGDPLRFAAGPSFSVTSE